MFFFGGEGETPGKYERDEMFVSGLAHGFGLGTHCVGSACRLSDDLSELHEATESEGKDLRFCSFGCD